MFFYRLVAKLHPAMAGGAVFSPQKVARGDTKFFEARKLEKQRLQRHSFKLDKVDLTSVDKE